jgi:hypothetical protein
MVIIKANADTEAGKMPTQKQLADMMEFNEQLVKAGIMLAGEGLHPSTKAKRVKFSRGTGPTVKDGPFAETKELIAGFWIWKVQSMDEAVEWAKRIPTSDEDPAESEVELRPVFDAEDFGAELTPELRQKEAELRARTSR